jgi:hypothetical protein
MLLTVFGPLTEGEIEALKRASIWKGDEALRSSSALHAAGDLMKIVFAAISAEEAANLLSVSTSEIARRLEHQSLLAIWGASGARLPTVQFKDGVTLPGLELVIPILLKKMSSLAAAWWLSGPHSELPPIDSDDNILPAEAPRSYLLRTLDIGRVVEIASWSPEC